MCQSALALGFAQGSWANPRAENPLGKSRAFQPLISHKRTPAFIFLNADTLFPYKSLPSQPHSILHSKLPLPPEFQKKMTLFMSSIYRFATLSLLSLLCIVQPSLSALVQEQPLVLKYHNGALLKGNITVNLIWYGQFSSIQRSIIVDFIHSLNSPAAAHPSAAAWWKTTEKYKGGSSTLVVGKQILHESYSLGKYLKNLHLMALASKVVLRNSINVVLTAKDVAVDGFCMNRCGTHGSTRARYGKSRGAFVWVGNSEAQCPGQCAWPFHQPIYGPQTPPLVAPNGDVGADGMIINLATVLAGAVTNPFNNGYFQGPASAPLEAVSACTGLFGKGAYPGYPGRVLVDKTTGASYNAHGVNGRKFLLPAMWDPEGSSCSTLV